jgi:hypothetical protein
VKDTTKCNDADRTTNGECPLSQASLPKSLFGARAESGEIGRLHLESWVDKIHLGFPRANWWL